MAVTAFDLSLDLFSPALREQVLMLRPYLTGRRRDSGVASVVGLAFDAAFAGDEAAAARCLAEAGERAGVLAADRAREAGDEEDRAAANRLQRTLARASRQSHPCLRLASGLSGQVSAPPPDVRAEAASDGSSKGGYCGWGYLSASGSWAMRAVKLGSRQGWLIAELRGAVMVADAFPGPVVLYMDCAKAIRYLAGWRDGDTQVPEGLDDPGLPERIRKRGAELEFRHVYGHRGHLLNEAADSLSRMARQRRAGETAYTLTELEDRAGSLVSAFLESWQQAP